MLQANSDDPVLVVVAHLSVLLFNLASSACCCTNLHLAVLSFDFHDDAELHVLIVFMPVEGFDCR